MFLFNFTEHISKSIVRFRSLTRTIGYSWRSKHQLFDLRIVSEKLSSLADGHELCPFLISCFVMEFVFRHYLFFIMVIKKSFPSFMQGSQRQTVAQSFQPAFSIRALSTLIARPQSLHSGALFILFSPLR